MARRFGVSAAVLTLLMTGQVGEVRGGPVRTTCAWDQYYDDHVQACGPCNELCDATRLSSTAQQCDRLCSEYVASTKCLADQYYDPVAKSCAPCGELCSEGDAKGRSHDCLHRCGKHVEAKQAGAGRSHPTSPDTDTGHTSSSWLPGIVATVTVSVMAVVAILGLTAVHRFRQTQGRYQPAPGRDVTNPPTNSEQATRVSTPVQVSNEDMAADQVVNGWQRQMSPLLGTAATQGDHVQYGIAETDPAAPSSAAFWHVQHQQYSC
ncbi:uncharacterized protein LOC143290853 [Babylonia areolata]|uniref:uncharacterized protein LOC143290853 n=1 Tax=Babylonia areolata TaxID=304850 RepID=UPI003FD39E6D